MRKQNKPPGSVIDSVAHLISFHSLALIMTVTLPEKYEVLHFIAASTSTVMTTYTEAFRQA